MLYTFSLLQSFIDDKEETGGRFHKLVADQREFFLSGKPAQLEHRIEQLKKLRAIIEAEGDALCNAVYKDLRRSPSLTFLYEIATLLGELTYCIDNVKVFGLFSLTFKLFKIFWISQSPLSFFSKQFNTCICSTLPRI